MSFIGILKWIAGIGQQVPALKWSAEPPSSVAQHSKNIVLEGDGSFSFDIVGESHCQAALDHIAGPKHEGGVEHECVAVLLPDDRNQYDENAVAVFIDGEKVGHLARRDAKAYRQFLANIGRPTAGAGCRAMIVGGWDDGDGDEGSYGVKLDVLLPFSQLVG